MNKEGWEIKKLGEVAEIEYGTRIVKKNEEGTIYPVYGGGGITFYSDNYNRENRMVVARFGLSPKCTRFINGKFFLNDSGLTVKSSSSNVNQEYLDVFLLCSNDKIYKLSRGAAQKNLNVQNFTLLNIPIPPLPIQEQIVKELDTLTDIIAKKQLQLSELDTLAQATFYEMFGNPVENEKGWKVRCLKDFYKDGKKAIKCGPFGSALKKEEYTSYGIPVWNMDNIDKSGKFIDNVNLWITPSKYKVLEAYDVLNGDIIISRAGTVGKMCVVTSQYPISIISTNLIRLRLNSNLSPLFFVRAMIAWGQQICRLKVGEDGAFTHMNTGVLNSIKMPFPPLPLQNQFAERIEAIEKQKELISQSIKEVQLLFDYTMDKYFN